MGITYTLYNNTLHNPHTARGLTTLSSGNVPDDVIEKMDLLNPVFTIKNNDFPNFALANYVKLGAPFNRSYFMGSPQAGADGITRIECHVDVIGTYIELLKECPCIANRSPNAWNMYLSDGEFKIYNYMNISTHEFSGSFSDFSMVLTVLGG